MDQLMYTLLHENAQSEPSVDVVVYYDNNNDRFFVTCAEKGTGCYVVERGELIGSNYKYTNEIIGEILSGIPADEDFVVLLTNSSRNSIALVCEGNRLLY